MEAKNEALELAEWLESHKSIYAGSYKSAAMLRSQAAEIEQWSVDFAEILRERDQLKAKNQKLVDALRELMGWQVKNVKVWSNIAYDNASRALKENI